MCDSVTSNRDTQPPPIPDALTRDQAASLKRRLQEYLNKVDTYLEHDQRATQELRASRKGAAETRKLATTFHEGLLRQGHEIADLLRAVDVEGFSELAPERSRKLLQRAIGIYTGFENGTAPPKKVEALKQLAEPAPIAAQHRPRRWSSPVTFVVLSLVGGALAGSGTSYLTARYGLRQTCVGGAEKECTPRNGVPHVQVCHEDGLGYGACLPLSAAR
ncbi:MAG: hypothetical protein RL033_4860 [Pseudomonadota bacterium]|jgi:hypothetical protein